MIVFDFSRYILKKFIQDDCFYRASALTFSTLLTIVPLIYITVFILSFLPSSQLYFSSLYEFVLNNFIPSTGYYIKNYLEQFIQQLTRPPKGDIFFLTCTVTLMLFTIEQALNVIWHTPKSRHNGRAFVLYLTMVMVTPCLLGLSLTMSSFIFSSSLFQTIPQISALCLSALPFLFSLGGFTLMYVILPNCKVRWRDGLWGGIFASLAFEWAKKGFALYLAQFHGYERLYGAFAVIPVFFMWIYLMWIITLVGAEISYACGHTPKWFRSKDAQRM